MGREYARGTDWVDDAIDFERKLDFLRPDDRLLIALRYMGLSFRQIADVYHMSHQGVAKRFRRAIEKLRE